MFTLLYLASDTNLLSMDTEHCYKLYDTYLNKLSFCKLDAKLTADLKEAT